MLKTNSAMVTEFAKTNLMRRNSEAINYTYAWYQKAAVCYAYLSDDHSPYFTVVTHRRKPITKLLSSIDCWIHLPFPTLTTYDDLHSEK